MQLNHLLLTGLRVGSERDTRVILNGYMSDWLQVLSGVPQGSALGPILFIVYINDLDVNLNSYMLKFADAKVFSEVSSLDKVANLQSDLDKLHKWSEDWQMMFNAQKCKHLHIYHKNTYANYSIGDVEVSNSSCVRDLGVVIDESLNYNRQCAKAVLSANKIMGIMNRTYSCKSKDNILNLCKSLVRPHHEYCCQAWRTYLQKDVDNIEKVQRCMTKMIPELSQLNYEERLCRTNLLSLEMCRLRADVSEVSKIVKGIDNVNQFSFFNPPEKQGLEDICLIFLCPAVDLILENSNLV